MLHPQRKTMDLVPLVCLCLLTWSAGTAADHKPVFVKVEEGSDVVLPCSLSTQENLVDTFFDWRKDGEKKKEVFEYEAGIHSNNGRTGQDQQFKGRVFHFEDQLKYGNASIKIRDTKIADSGDYICYFPFLQPPQTFYIELVVGAAPEPSVVTLKTDDGMLLQCAVRGASPKPKVEWKDSAGNILPAKEPQVTERGGSYDVILQAPLTKTDHFRCVVTQEDNNHQIYTETYVHFSAATGLVVGVSVPIVLLVVGFVLVQTEL